VGSRTTQAEPSLKNPVLLQGALALAAGMTAQGVAERLRLPSIVLLLAAGMLLGREGLGVIDPRDFGTGRDDLVSLAVIVILFEGALGLDLARLRGQQRSLLLLLTIGAATSFAGASAAAHWLVGLAWPIAALYGSLMIVTGPTVVTPLLARLRVDRRVREILISEGVLIDPLGAVVALAVAEWAVGRADLASSAPAVALRLSVGAVIGAASGLALALVLRRRWLPEHLIPPAALALALFAASWANAVSPEAGLMAAVAAGVALGNAGVPDLGRLRSFKETLTLILLSFVFVLLAADVSLRDVEALGLPALGAVGVVLWVCRPLGVFASTLGSGLSLRERAFMSWICPRGIVAAAVAGLFAILLDEAGVAGGGELQALVFVTVAVSVTLQGLTARTVARRLGIDFPNLLTTIVVGADRIGRLLARLLVAQGREAVLLDRSPLFVRQAQREGLPVVSADALSAAGLEEAGAARADTLVALTRNAELNALIAQRARENFRIERLLAWTEEEAGERAPDRPRRPFPGRFPGVDEVNAALRGGRLALIEYEVREEPRSGMRVADLPFADGEFALLARRGERVVVVSGEHALARGDRLWFLGPRSGESRTGQPLVLLQETSP
jgi:NhaP-type Na+/H+ or K+/H+ antiporter